jgi:hypothetical protein
MGTSLEAATDSTRGNGGSATLGTAIEERARPQVSSAARYQRLAD